MMRMFQFLISQLRRGETLLYGESDGLGRGYNSGWLDRSVCPRLEAFAFIFESFLEGFAFTRKEFLN